MPEAANHESTPKAPERTQPGALPTARPAVLPEDALVLPLDLLIPDAEGRIALVEGVGNVPIAIATNAPVEKEGLAEAGIRAGGVDVGGHRFLQFATGVTLYFPESAEVTVIPE